MPQLVEETIPSTVSYAMLEKILRNLLREGVPIRDLATIVEAAADSLGSTRDMDMVTENVRGALARTITRRARSVNRSNRSKRLRSRLQNQKKRKKQKN